MKNKRNKALSLLDDMFGFESGIDISDDCALLYRRNVVIKNIILVSNLIYTLILMVISFGEESNWVLTIVFFPLTFLINNTLKKMIYKNPKDILKQQIAMYMACFYMFLSAILIYFKLKTGSEQMLGEAGYILLYYSLVVVSLYQDKKMLTTIFKWLIGIVTLLHFTITYNIIGEDYAKSLERFLTTFFTTKEFKDIFLRTIILLAFMLVVYSIVAMAQYMQEERKKELLKRKAVQDDFTDVVTQMFDVTLSSQNISEEEKEQGDLLSLMSSKFASIIGLSPQTCEEVKRYSIVHLVEHIDLNIIDIVDKDEQFEKLRTQTNLGAEIIRRLQLKRKCEDIIRAHEEGWNTDDFVQNIEKIQNNQESQIILICDIYITLRSVRSYKRPYPHKVTMELLDREFKQYFDGIIYDRFVRFQSDFEKLYNEY